MQPSEDNAVRALLNWYADMGVADAVAPQPTNFFDWGPPKPADAPPPDGKALRAPSTPIAAPPAETPSSDEAIAAAKTAANACTDFAALDAALRAFDQCPLKAGAKNTVFTDGVFGSELLVIGEGPGRDEDIQGKPFVGRAGQLLDKMLAAIGRSRADNTMISNVVFWRPPGNRTPTAVETAICKPFVERLIELSEPKAIMLAGGAPMQALLGLTGIMRQRGQWRDLTTTGGVRVPAMPIFHPAFLLRQPANKRLAWRDLQALEKRLRDG